MPTKIADSGIGIKGTGPKHLVNKLLSGNLERILSVPGGRMYRRFMKATRNVELTQRALLNDIIDQTKNTAFGREHRFATINSYEDYRDAVPIRDFEGHRHWVDRHVHGEEDVLFTGKPMMFAKSSGTTALPKLIPISEYNFQRTIKNRGKLWLHGLARNYPGVYAGKDFTIVSPSVDGYTDSGIPFGSVSGVMYQNIPDFIKLVHTLPYEVMTIENYEAKSYVLLRFGVPSDVSIVLTPNPATIRNLVERTDAMKETLIRDVHDGTLIQDIDLDPKVRALLEERLRPAPQRAAELEKLAEKAGQLRPEDYWPNLALVHCWKCGNTGLVVDKIKPWFRKGQPILEFGYVASEISATDLIDPATDGSLLAILNGFYEFKRLEEEDSPNPRFLMANELEVGARYFIYVTTLSGLYRYDMNDVLECVGHINQLPLLKFQYKGKGVTNLQGEKFSEAQMIESVKRASEKEKVEHEFFVGYADNEKLRYELYIELPNDLADEQMERFSTAVDNAMQQVNLEYEAKRQTERLGPLTIVPLKPQSFDYYREMRRAEGTNDGQMKWMQLTSQESMRDKMRTLLREPADRV